MSDSIDSDSIDATWVGKFVLQLTHQQVSPDAIERSIRDVRLHCIDSGQTPQEAFGDPRSYATTLAAELPPESASPVYSGRRFAMLLPTMLGLAVGAISLGAEHGSTPVSVGQILLVTVAVPAWVALTAPLARPRRRDPLVPHRRAFDERGWRGLWVTLALAAIGAILWIGLDQTVFQFAPWIPATVGAALFAIGMSLFWLLAPRGADARTG